MNASRRFSCHCLALYLFAALATVVFADPPPVDPAQVLIGGVPFISIAEGCAIEHPSLLMWHPSARAAHMMALRYNQADAKTWEDYLKATDDRAGALREKEGEARDLEELGALLSAGNPVVVVTASTPYAHSLYGVFEMLLAAGGEYGGMKLQDLDARDYSSQLLGRMVGLDVHRKMAETKMESVTVYGGPAEGAARMNPLHEIAMRCSRVVVGLDPVRRVVIVHDPVFGPAWEVPYNDFERMWSAADRMYSVLERKDGTRSSAATTSAYPPRTPDQRAAEEYLYGYSLAATGKTTEADERYRAGLSIEDLSVGYRFLFLQERGYLAYRRGDPEEAVSLLRQATEQIPQAPVPWQLMAEICGKTGAAGGKPAANEFEGKADKLWADQAGLRAGLELFPDNLVSSWPLIAVVPSLSPG